MMFDGRFWLEVLGWAGTGILVVSLVQGRMLRLRWMNLLACILLVGYNAALSVWPMVAMNGIVALINIYYIVTLSRRGRHNTTDPVAAGGDPLKTGTHTEMSDHR